MIEILLGQSYYLRFDPKLWEAMQPYPPLGTLYAASYLQQKGYQVGLFDAMLAESEDNWLAILRQHRPKIAVLYEDNFNYLSKMCLLRMRQAAFRMIDMARWAGSIVVAAGADASDNPAMYLAAGADYVIIGEGEVTLGELSDWIFKRSPKPLLEIPGLAMVPRLGEKPKVLRTPPRMEIKALDELPFPAWNLVDIDRYREIWTKSHGYFSMNMAATRGCPFHCNWCAKPIWGQRYHMRSPENVARELKLLKDSYAPDHIWFVDDIFGLQAGWMAQFANALRANGGGIPFKSLNRADLLLRPGEIEALKQAGCRTVWIGAESGSQKILDAMQKGTRVEQIVGAAQRLHQAGIQTGFFLQFGYPGETRQDISQTFRMVRQCLPDDIGVSVSYPLPGTPFYERVRLELGSKRHWKDSSDLAMLYRGPFSTAFYRQLHSLMHTEFRLLSAWRMLVRLPRSENHSFWKLLKKLLANAIRLPYDRLRLEILAHQPHDPTSLPPEPLAPEEPVRSSIELF